MKQALSIAALIVLAVAGSSAQQWPQPAEDQHDPGALIFDGTNPYDGLAALRERYPDLPFVWSRRGMWKEGTGAEMIERRHLFDLLIEPGDVASPVDRGATAFDAEDVVKVGPVVYLDESELLNAIMGALDAHTAMSTQALNSEGVQQGLKEVLLNNAGLYESLRAQEVSSSQFKE